MIDARRMEVYAAVFENGKQITETAPAIIDENSYAEYLEQGPVLFIGDGAGKCADVIKHPNAHFCQCHPKASSMLQPALQALKERVDDPRFEEIINSQVPADKRPTPEQFEKLRTNIRKMELTQDAMSGHIGPLGDITVRIVERAEPKLVKMELEGAPIGVTMWIQMLPSDENTSRLKVTLGAELNFFIRKMIGAVF